MREACAAPCAELLTAEGKRSVGGSLKEMSDLKSRWGGFSKDTRLLWRLNIRKKSGENMPAQLPCAGGQGKASGQRTVVRSGRARVARGRRRRHRSGPTRVTSLRSELARPPQ